MAVYAASDKKVNVDAMTDSIYFPDWKLLSLWHTVGDWADIVRAAEGNKVYVVNDGDMQRLVHIDLWSLRY